MTSTVAAERSRLIDWNALGNGSVRAVAPFVPTPAPALALERMHGALTVARRARLYLEGSLLAMAPAACLGAAAATQVLTTNTQMIGAGVMAALGAVAVGAIAQVVQRRRIAAVDPFEPRGSRPLTPVEEAVLAEVARRSRAELSFLMRASPWQRAVTAQGAVTNEASPNIQQLFTLLFSYDTLEPVRCPDYRLEAIVHCLDKIPEEDLPFVRAIVEDVFRHAPLEQAKPGTVNGYRRALLEAALHREPFRWSGQVDADLQVPAELVRVDAAAHAEIDFDLKRSALAYPEECPWGRARVDDLATALRIAAHWEAANYRVSIAPYSGRREQVSVVAYKKDKAPPSDLHRRLSPSEERRTT